MIGTAMGLLIGSLVAGGSQVVGSKLQTNAAKKAAKLQTDSANVAADIQAKSAKEALDYAKGVENTRRAEWDQTQNLNYDQYRTRENNLQPFRDVGAQGVQILGATVRPGSGEDYQVRPTLNSIGR